MCWLFFRYLSVPLFSASTSLFDEAFGLSTDALRKCLNRRVSMEFNELRFRL